MEGFKENFYFQVILCNCYTSVDIVSSHYISKVPSCHTIGSHKLTSKNVSLRRAMVSDTPPVI